MEILFVTLTGAALGGALRYLLPRRERYGVVLLPACGAAVSAAVWVALTWAGLAWDAGLIWALTLAAAAIACGALAWLLSAGRQRNDDALFEQIASGRSPATAEG